MLTMQFNEQNKNTKLFKIDADNFCEHCEQTLRNALTELGIPNEEIKVNSQNKAFMVSAQANILNRIPEKLNEYGMCVRDYVEKDDANVVNFQSAIACSM